MKKIWLHDKHFYKVTYNDPAFEIITKFIEKIPPSLDYNYNEVSHDASEYIFLLHKEWLGSFPYIIVYYVLENDYKQNSYELYLNWQYNYLIKWHPRRIRLFDVKPKDEEDEKDYKEELHTYNELRDYMEDADEKYVEEQYETIYLDRQDAEELKEWIKRNKS